MKLKNLNKEELKSVNGGTDQSNSIGLSGTIGAGTLLQIDTYSKDGDTEQSNSLIVGKDINLNLGGGFNNSNS